MSAMLTTDRAAARGTAIETTSRGTTVRWMRTLVAKDGLTPILVRVVLVPVLLTIAGVAFMVFGPAPIRPNAVGGVDDDQAVFLLLGYMLLGQLVIIVSGAWLYLRDVLSHSLGGTYTAVPNRCAVVVGTALAAALAGAVGALLSVLVGALTFVVLGHADLVATLSSPRLLQMLVVLPVGAALLSIIAVAVAVLVRRPIPAAVLLVVWATYGEDAVGLIPGLGPVFKALLPLTNVHVAAGIKGVLGISGSPFVALLWVTVTAAVMLAIAVAAERRRRGWVS
ncbi:hypothetical protein [Austwickia chelonae]|uniref:hypothetical protein n=1 Tax=Austwickia chelonae TaxID=100225 RepID=UPI000E279A26|nr:hypothetical protein [Austwickia chelonae]